MSDAKAKRLGRDVKERPLDPSRNAEDILGETSGRYGVTRGSTENTSAEPDDVYKDTSVMQGGVRNTPTNPTGIREDTENNALYNRHVREGMSDVMYDHAMDVASEQDVPATPERGGEEHKTPIPTKQEVGKQVLMGNSANKKYTPPTPPDVSGEESESGSAPDPQQIQDEDRLQSAQNVGEQLKGDTEELGIGEDIDEAEVTQLES